MKKKLYDFCQIFETKWKFDKYISNGRLYSLFVLGIAIQVISLFASTKSIMMMVVFSPAIVLMIRSILLLLDEIKPTYKKIISEEDKHKKENA